MLLLALSEVCAQREVLYDQYIENPMAINPAFTGMRENFDLTLILRRRWLTVPNVPLSQTLAADGVIANGKVGVGFMALNDRMSPYATTGFYGSGSYIHETASQWKLAVGVQGGVNVLPVYGAFSGRKVLGSMGIGLWAQSPYLYAGLSKPELLSLQSNNLTTKLDFGFPYYLTAGGRVPVDDFTIAPNLTLIANKNFSTLLMDSKTEIHIGSKFWYKQLAGIGAFLRTGSINRIHVTVDVQAGRNIRLGYVYNSRMAESGYIPIGTGPQGMHELLFKFIPNPGNFHYN